MLQLAPLPPHTRQLSSCKVQLLQDFISFHFIVIVYNCHLTPGLLIRKLHENIKNQLLVQILVQILVQTKTEKPSVKSMQGRSLAILFRSPRSIRPTLYLIFPVIVISAMFTF